MSDNLTAAYKTAPVVAAFLYRLDRAGPLDVIDDVPGISGTWQVEDIRDGLLCGAIVIHHTGGWLAMNASSDHGRIGSNCRCCLWYRRMMARDRQAGPSRRWAEEAERKKRALASAFGLED